jgi:tetratricopeptide (TPR) repeat protein
MTRLVVLGLVLASQFIALSYSQTNPSEQLQVQPPFVRPSYEPGPNATAKELEERGDILREEKSFFEALDMYRAAIAKEPHSAKLYNKAGMTELQAEHLRSSIHYFERAIKLDPKFAAAHNNLGAAHYEERKYRSAIKEYKKAIKLEPDDASYYSNLGAVYFSKKQWENANKAYAQAVILDPDIFERTSRHGIAAQMSSPEDRAHFQFVLAGLYAKGGNMDRALLCLRRAMEGGYKNINSVYKDDEFANLRKDPRFAELMANPPKALPN